MKLVFIENNRPVTDSLTVADAFEKNHADVLRDIRFVLDQVEGNWGVSNFAHTPYVHPQNNQTYHKYLISEQGFTLLVMGYTGSKAMKFKVDYINEFNRMREELTKPQFIMPTNMLETAELWISELKRNEYLESKNKQLALESAAQQQQLKDQEAPGTKRG